MAKYTEQFKLSVIEDYLSGTKVYQEIAKAYGLDRSMVRRWIATYKIHSVASLQKKYRHYSVKFKLGALKHMREHSLSHRETAAHFDIRSIGNNAAMESFFGTLKSEFFYLKSFRDVDELQAGLSQYIHYYNHDRIKLKLGGLSPVQYRIQTA